MPTREEMGLLLRVRHFGVVEAGDEADASLVNEFKSAGFVKAEGVPALCTLTVAAEGGVAGGVAGDAAGAPARRWAVTPEPESVRGCAARPMPSRCCHRTARC